MTKNAGVVIWITGLSGAGKTTIARRLSEVLREEGHANVFLDGDEIRQAMSSITSGHDPESRLAIARAYSKFSKMISDQGHIVIVATMSLFHEVQAWNRGNIPNYIEVFVQIPIEILRKRDPKGLYAKAAEGDILHVAGVNMSYEFPLNPDITLDNSKSFESISSLVEQITTLIHQNKER